MKLNTLNKAIALALAASTITLVGCVPEDGAPGATGSTGEIYSTALDFTEVTPAITEEEKNVIRTSTEVTIAGESQTISYTTLMKTGDVNNGETFGIVKDYQDQVAKAADNSDYLCNGTDEGVGSGLDHVSLLQKNGKTYMVSQFECAPGAMYMNEVTQNATTGALSATPETLQFVSQKSDFGGWVHCAGMTSPWQSHIGSEEYEPDARANVTTSGYPLAIIDSYWGADATKYSPYYYGWTPEVKVNADGTPDYTKHYSMGRFAHELAYVMPDEKTVYLTDDGNNGMLFMFVADTAQDLSAGTLYAAKWHQVSADNAGSATLTWISLGHASNADVKALLNQDDNIDTGADAITFADIFAIEAPNVDGSCPTPGDGITAGFKNVNTANGNECLQLKDVNGDASINDTDIALAGRLESRRMGAILGATSEFSKKEGVTFNAKDNQLYVVMSRIYRGMTDNDATYDLGGNNDIQLTENTCGAVYALDVASNGTIGSDYVAYSMKGLIAGIPTDYTGTALEGNSCDVSSVAEPDNATFLEGTNTLVIGEDTSKHPNDMVWSYDLNTGKMQRIATGPYGSEMTNSYWYKDINGFGYLTNTAQHPFGEVSGGYVRPAGVSVKSEVGVVGPFDFSKLK